MLWGEKKKPGLIVQSALTLTDARACAGASANGKIADSTALLDGAPKGRSSSHSELDIVPPITLFFPRGE